MRISSKGGAAHAKITYVSTKELSLEEEKVRSMPVTRSPTEERFFFQLMQRRNGTRPFIAELRAKFAFERRLFRFDQLVETRRDTGDLFRSRNIDRGSRKQRSSFVSADLSLFGIAPVTFVSPDDPFNFVATQ